MGKPQNVPSEDVEVRSVLMRLYHSRQFGESFYPAQLVNGYVPQMEADGWIERHEQGWRLTGLGVQVWAEMNRSILRYKHQYGQKMFNEIRERLTGKEEIMASTICVVEGCNESRMQNGRGETLTMCDEHQRAYWRNQAAKNNNAKAGNTPTPALPQNTGEGAKPKRKTDAIVRALNGLQEDINRAVKPQADQQQFDVEALDDFDREHVCETCTAKAVVEALRAKSPKLAALIDAMEAQERAAHELGL